MESFLFSHSNQSKGKGANSFLRVIVVFIYFNAFCKAVTVHNLWILRFVICIHRFRVNDSSTGNGFAVLIFLLLNQYEFSVFYKVIQL